MKSWQDHVSHTFQIVKFQLRIILGNAICAYPSVLQRAIIKWARIQGKLWLQAGSEKKRVST